MQSVRYELIILDDKNVCFDTIGEYNSLEDAIEARENYAFEHPEEIYQIVKVTREDVQ